MDEPEEFKPDFSKEFEINGNIFTIEVQYQGLEYYYGVMHKKWLYRVIWEGLVLTASHFRWDASRRNIENENAANHLASFYGYGDFKKLKADAIKEAEIDRQEGEPGILTIGTPVQIAQYVVWMEFYENRIPAVPLDKVEVVTLKSRRDNWVAIVSVDASFAEKNLYKLQYDARSKQVRVEIYDWVRAHTLTTI